MGSSSRSFSLNQSYNMKAFIVLFALIAAAYAEAEAEADPYRLYGGYAGYAGWGGWTGYAGFPYGAYGYAAYPHGATAVVKSVETEPAKVEVKALTAPAVVAAPAAYTYPHAAPVAYAGYAGYPYAHHLLGKREAEADADPAYFYNGYAGYAGYGFGYGYAGYPYAGFYGGYPYAAYRGAYTHAAYAHAPSDPTNPHLVHTSRVGVCTNYLGAQVPC